MKKLMVISLMLFMLVGCSSNNISFKATIESINDNTMMIQTSDDVGFDLASVDLQNAKINGELSVGQQVILTIKPEILETYPVKVNAIKVEPVKASYQKIGADIAKNMIDSNNYDVILDVRNLDEYNQGHIDQATLLPVDQIQAKAQDVLTDKNAVILVYCRSGNRSQKAAKQLIEMGYTNVYDFGGISDWPYEIVK